MGIGPPPISPTSEMVWCGARNGRLVTRAVRPPGRPATRGMRVVSRVSARLLFGPRLARRAARPDMPPWRPQEGPPGVRFSGTLERQVCAYPPCNGYVFGLLASCSPRRFRVRLWGGSRGAPITDQIGEWRCGGAGENAGRCSRRGEDRRSTPARRSGLHP